MIRVLSLLWTFVASFLVSSLSYFYVNDSGRHGFPFGFAKDVVVDGTLGLSFNYWSFALNMIFWWFLFSILTIVLKNYVFEAD